MSRKKLRDLTDFAMTQGWTISHTNGGHLRFSKPGLPPIFTSSTPSDYRAERNMRAQLRRTDRQIDSRDSHDRH